MLFGCFLALAVLSLQPVMGKIAPFGAMPDLVLALACVYAIRLGGAAGIWIGFAAGVLHGSMIGKSLGSFCASRTLAAWFAVWAGGFLPRESLICIGLTCWAATWVAEVGFFVLSPRVGFAQWAATVALTALLNAVAGIVLCRLIDIFDRLSNRGRARQRRALARGAR